MRLSGVSGRVIRLCRGEVGIYHRIKSCGIGTKHGICSQRQRRRGLTSITSGIRGSFSGGKIHRLCARLVSVDEGLRCRGLMRTKTLKELPFVRVSSLRGSATEIIFRKARNTCKRTTVRRFFKRSIGYFRMEAFHSTVATVRRNTTSCTILPVRGSSTNPIGRVCSLLSRFRGCVITRAVLPMIRALSKLPKASLASVGHICSGTRTLVRAAKFLGSRTS